VSYADGVPISAAHCRYPDDPVDCPWPGSSALHYAASAGKVEVALKLLASGANPNHQNTLSSTPLHYAVYMQRRRILDLLLEHGAGASLKVKGRSVLWDHARTPAELAVIMQKEVAMRSGGIVAALADNEHAKA
jgi:ankyrin repeat protein